MVGLISKMSSSSESIWLKVWHKLVPFKVYCLVWKKNHSRLATRDIYVEGVSWIKPRYNVWVWRIDNSFVFRVSCVFRCLVRYMPRAWSIICFTNGRTSSSWVVRRLAKQRKSNLNVHKCDLICRYLEIKAGNDNCFHNKRVSNEKMMEDVKIFSWNWIGCSLNQRP